MRTMSKTNLEGDKVGQTKISKIVFSANIRQKRLRFVPKVGQERPSNICQGCGFHVRGKNHSAGAHHTGTVAPCKR